MKKFIWSMAIAATILGTSCSHKQSENQQTADPYAISQGMGDTISSLYGTMVGGYILSDYLNFDPDHQNAQMKEDLIKGIRIALSEGTQDGVMMGMQVGMRMAQELKSFEDRGVPVDREAVLRNFIEAFGADSVDISSLQELNTEFSTLSRRIDMIEEARQAAEIANSPEAIQNAQTGRAFIDKVKAENPDAVQTESGLVYVIEEKGDTTTIAPNSMVTLYYTGSLVDGTVFDSTDEGSPRTFAPAGTIPGFSEGLQLLGKGGKATLYIPGELAYGINAPAAIGPNQTLVFKVEIVDVANR